MRSSSKRASFVPTRWRSCSTSSSSSPPSRSRPGRRVAIVTNAGGPAILAGRCLRGARARAPFACPRDPRPAPRLPTCAGRRSANPIDMIASASPEDYARTIAAVGTDPNVDAIVVTHVPTMVSVPEEIGAGIAGGVGEMPPREAGARASTSPLKGRRCRSTRARAVRFPVTLFPENAALALAAAARYSRWRRRPPGQMFELERFAASSIRAVIDRVIAADSEPDVAYSRRRRLCALRGRDRACRIGASDPRRRRVRRRAHGLPAGRKADLSGRTPQDRGRGRDPRARFG